MKHMTCPHRRFGIFPLLLGMCVALVGCGWGVNPNLFQNPLLPTGADPWVTTYNGSYYYMDTTGANLTLRKTQDISDLRHAQTKVVWTPEGNQPWSYDVWAPELHHWGEAWYIYFTADDGTNETHRIYVVENTAADPMDGTWRLKGKVSDATDRWAIDPDLFEINGQHYLLWSGWPGATDGEQDIYIAQMSNPWTINSARVKIATPTYAWEQTGLAINEGPEAVVHNGQLSVTYSASGCWTDAYKLGLLQAADPTRLLDASTWRKLDHPVLEGDAETQVYGPGHNGFFKSSDGTGDWLIYHANGGAGEGCGSTRTPRVQPFTWNSDGTPHFGTPVATTQYVPKPSH